MDGAALCQQVNKISDRIAREFGRQSEKPATCEWTSAEEPSRAPPVLSTAVSIGPTYGPANQKCDGGSIPRSWRRSEPFSSSTTISALGNSTETRPRAEESPKEDIVQASKVTGGRATIRTAVRADSPGALCRAKKNDEGQRTHGDGIEREDWDEAGDRWNSERNASSGDGLKYQTRVVCTPSILHAGPTSAPYPRSASAPGCLQGYQESDLFQRLRHLCSLLTLGSPALRDKCAARSTPQKPRFAIGASGRRYRSRALLGNPLLEQSAADTDGGRKRPSSAADTSDGTEELDTVASLVRPHRLAVVVATIAGHDGIQGNMPMVCGKPLDTVETMETPRDFRLATARLKVLRQSMTFTGRLSDNPAIAGPLDGA